MNLLQQIKTIKREWLQVTSRNAFRTSGALQPPSSPVCSQITESKNEFLVGATSLSTITFDRATGPRDEVLEQCLVAWRFISLVVKG
jgi:hypothetical protein